MNNETHNAELIERCISVASELIDTGDYENATTLCEKALSLDASNVDALNLLCLLSFNSGKFRKSLSLLEKVIGLIGETAELQLNRAILLQKARRFGDAIKSFNQVIEQLPNNPEPYTNLAEIYLELGREDDALDAISNAIRLGEQGDEANQHRHQILQRVQAAPLIPVSEDIVNNDAFCVLPWIHSYFFPSGAATLCCVSATPLLDDNNSPLNIQTHSLEEIWDSTALRNIRSSMLKGRKLSNCSNCYTEEKFSNNSHRLMYNARWLQEKNNPDAKELLQKIVQKREKPILKRPLSVDYRFGNICNLKCQICNAGNSSQIEKDQEHARWNQASFIRIKPNRFSNIGETEEWYESAELIKEINDFSGDVLDVKMAGGEPTLNKSLLAFMQGLVESGKSKEVELSISTNFTTGNRRLYQIFSAFKRIRVFMSIDGYKSMNDYLRFPSKWSIIEKNVDYVKELQKTVPVEIAIAPVLNAYNTLTITELFEWADQLGFGNVADIVRGVDHIDCLLLPRTTREKSILRLEKYAESIQDTNKLSFINTLCDKLSEEWPTSKMESNIRKFVQFTNYIDTSRGLSFRNVAPETYNDMQEHYGDIIMAPLHMERITTLTLT